MPSHQRLCGQGNGRQRAAPALMTRENEAHSQNILCSVFLALGNVKRTFLQGTILHDIAADGKLKLKHWRGRWPKTQVGHSALH